MVYTPHTVNTGLTLTSTVGRKKNETLFLLFLMRSSDREPSKNDRHLENKKNVSFIIRQPVDIITGYIDLSLSHLVEFVMFLCL